MSITANTLATSRCAHQVTALDEAAIAQHIAALPEWKIDGGKLARSFAFKDYYQTLAFVNAIAWIIHAEDHHPDLAVSYNRCGVKFDTHSVNDGKGGLSINDFICAAKVDAVFAQRNAS
ncbi:4a-hydroxytetrahydrobiopterin dehydratase [Herbaspirillum sp. LeCh32-8]|uniref:4a-hydroxytetrahydrobiopterin dehydratase n=1 Tax=Herbaspirillum sp. LeCh32-8 TaxID=2821356 RepID=UPI001AE42B5A|nr:4a-hydroxytetrahydrobiopterin dehydratase [Herbaspirillum sp. LeCh32-8]MBP0599186.1 4a-hydroxytetrahydrobiopterin dehydratase [Herbaspirillum sp. LeCh32-8]